MGVYIEGMKMPPKGEYRMTLYVCDDGYAYMDVDLFPVDKDRFEAVPVPEHGDLIGREWLIDIALHLMHTAKNDEIANGVKWLLKYIIEAPTIIPAEPPKEET